MAIIPSNNQHALLNEVNGKLDGQNLSQQFWAEDKTHFETYIKPGSWVEPTFQNTYTNSTENPSTAYRKAADGRIYIRGTVKRAGAFTPQLSPIFTLPEGYRPSGRLIFGTFGGVSGGAGKGTRIDILTNGQVILIEGAVTSVDFLGLDNISFYTS